MNKIIWCKKARKSLKKLQVDKQKQIYKSIEKLELMPECSNVKKLTNHIPEYRLRVGSYRVFFEFDGAIKVVSIEDIKKRDNRTY